LREAQVEELAHGQAIRTHPEFAGAGHVAVVGRRFECHAGGQFPLGAHGRGHLRMDIVGKGGAVNGKGVAGEGDATPRFSGAGRHIADGSQVAQKITLGGKAVHRDVAFLPRLVAATGEGFAVFRAHTDAAIGVEGAPTL